MMNVFSDKVLKYLDRLLKYGNFTKAAQSLYISQPYLTQKIQKIEKKLGVEIINRQGAPLHLTEAGKLYYEYLLSLESDKERFQKRLSKYSQLQSTVIRVGILSSLGNYLLPLFLPAFLEKNPNIKIDLLESTQRENEKRVNNGELDFLIGQTPETLGPNLKVYNGGYHAYHAIIPQYSQFYRSNMTLLEAETIPIKSLLEEKLILTTKGSSIRQQVDYLLDKYSVDPNIILETNNIFTALKLAQRNLGVTIVPEHIVIDKALPHNRYPIPCDLISIHYFIAHHRNKTLNQNEKRLITLFQNALNLEVK